MSNKTTWIDTHAHLDGDEFKEDLGGVLGRAAEAGVAQVVCPAITLASSLKTLALSASHAVVLPAVGIHPNCAGEAAADDWARIEALAQEQRDRIVALGETGLDWYRDHTPRSVQQDYFARHLRLAARLDRPVIVHCRDAEEDMLPMLREAMGQRPFLGVMHACAAGKDVVDEYVKLGLYVSFAGTVTFSNKSCEPIRQAARAVPRDRLLVETDSPYLTPQPFRGKLRRNEPAMVVHTGRYLAELRGVPEEELARQTTDNARHLFGIA